MGFLHSSRAKGRIPAMLKAASEVRYLGHEAEGNDGTLLHFEVPIFGSVAEELFRQKLLWEDGPQPDQTAFELLGAALSDVAAQRKESDRYDPGMLRRISSYRRTLRHGLSSISLPDTNLSSPGVIDDVVLEAAAALTAVTPESRRVRVAGRLDLMGASQSVLKLELRSGAVITALWEGTQEVDSLAEYFNRDVVIEGAGIFRPSGRILRIDADAIATASGQDEFFREEPLAPTTRESIRDYAQSVRLRPSEKSVYASLLGVIPTEESDEAFAAAIEAMS